MSVHNDIFKCQVVSVLPGNLRPCSTCNKP